MINFKDSKTQIKLIAYFLWLKNTLKEYMEEAESTYTADKEMLKEIETWLEEQQK